MTTKQNTFWVRIRTSAALILISAATQNVSAGSLLSAVDSFLTGQYPVATAYLSLYDPGGALIDWQEVDATDLLSSGYVNTGSEILFNGSLTFPDPYPYMAGGSGGSLVTVHDFSIDLATAINSSWSDLVNMQIDWVYSSEPISEIWGLTIADDFVNGIAYRIYGAYPPQALLYGYASFSLEFATGVAQVPLPAAMWFLISGLLGLASVSWKRKR